MPKKFSDEVSMLFDTVVEGDYCSGCGACASVENSPIKMILDRYGRYQASLDSKEVFRIVKKLVQSNQITNYTVICGVTASSNIRRVTIAMM